MTFFKKKIQFVRTALLKKFRKTSKSLGGLYNFFFRIVAHSLISCLYHHIELLPKKKLKLEQIQILENVFLLNHHGVSIFDFEKIRRGNNNITVG